jgi:hypothetical protein
MSRKRTSGAKRALEAERKFHRRGRELAAQAKRRAKQAARGRQSANRTTLSPTMGHS